MSRKIIILGIPHFNTLSSYLFLLENMNFKRIRSDPRSRDVAFSDGEFSFQPKTGGSSRG